MTTPAVGAVGAVALAAGALGLVTRRTAYAAWGQRDTGAIDGLTPVRTGGRRPTRLAWAPPSSGESTVVFFHGNGTLLSQVSPVAAALRADGFGVAAVEYPGYGTVPGRPSRRVICEAARGVLAELIDRQGVHPGRIVLCGHSLGSAVATVLASEGYGCGLVLVSPFTSALDLCRVHAAGWPARLLVNTERWDTLALAPGIRQPTVIVHGAHDRVAPVWMGERLAEAFPRSRLVVLPGAAHSDVDPAQIASACRALGR